MSGGELWDATLRVATVGLGGCLGAIARYAVGGWVHRWYDGTFPLGTLVINVLGCLVLGVLMALVEEGRGVSPQVRLFVGVGICGAFTTFSTFGYETVQLMGKGTFAPAVANVVASVLCGLVAVWLGATVVRSVLA